MRVRENSAMWLSREDEAAVQALRDVIGFARACMPRADNDVLEEACAQKTVCDILALFPESQLPEGQQVLEGCYLEREVHYMLSSFDTHSEHAYTLVPAHIKKRWQSVAEHIRQRHTAVAGLMAPLSWQISIPFYQTARARSLPVVLLPERNIPVAALVLERTGSNFVTTTPVHAEALSLHLREHDMPDLVQLWHMVVPYWFSEPLPEFSADVYIEAHLFPGLPIGMLHSISSEQKEHARYGLVPSDSYLFEIKDDTCYVTSLTRDAYPLFRYRLKGVAKRVDYDDKTYITFTDTAYV